MRYSAKIIMLLLFFPLSGCGSFRSFFKDNTDEFLHYLLSEGEINLRQFVTSAAACEASRELQQENMAPLPVYIRNGQGVCVSADVNAADQPDYFSDQGCDNPVSFASTDYRVFCEEIIALENSNTILGDAAVWEPNDTPVGDSPSRKWTIPYGTRMKFTTESLKGSTVPYMKRVSFKTIEDIRNPDGSTRGSGTCKLEMRIYKRDITASNLQPLLALHGGSWKLRSAGFPGLESSISHFTDQGFIVFAPFYRLTGDKEANAECNNASWQELVADVEDALTWVWNHGEAVGAAPDRPVALTGQSAGAHLATWLLAHGERHNVPVSRALLLYPPTDFNDFVAHAVAGGRYEAYIDGIKTFENFFGVDDISQVSADALAANSFPALVHRNPDTPPVFIIHGAADRVVPSMQSVRLCNAYDRDPGTSHFDTGAAANDGGDPDNGVYMRQYKCGAEGELHLLAEADHIFDLKCIPNLLCPAGSEQTVPVLEASLQAGRRWLMQKP
jgi:acetyl esterase/lipase